MKEGINKDLGHFILRQEDYSSTVNWLSNHRHKFLCNVYDRVKYAVENNKEKVKLYDFTSRGKVLKRYNIKTDEILNGNYITNTMLSYFEREEHYDKCSNIVKWLNKNKNE